MKRFADAIDTAKEHLFVGRSRECELFRRLLQADNKAASILNIFGLGGVGKSFLLDQYERIATDHDAKFFRIDSRDFAHTSHGFMGIVAHLLNVLPSGGPDRDTLQQCLARLEALSQQTTVVLAIDTYEEMHSLDRWLRERFISRLPQNVILIISGRMSLLELWRPYPHWCELVQPVPLDLLTLDEVSQIAELYGVTHPATVNTLYELTEGHPLTLALVLERRTRGEPEADLHSDLKQSRTALAYRWLREIKDDKIRRIAEAAVLVRSFEQDLLEHMIEEPITPDEFNRLVGVSFVRKTGAGWSVHDLLQKHLSREIRLRTPAYFKRLWERSIQYYYLRLLRTDDPDLRARLMEELFFVLGDPLIRQVFFVEGPDTSYFGEQAGESHRDEVASFINQLIDHFQQLRVNLQYVGADAAEHRHQMPARYFQREAEMLREEQLLASLGIDAFHLIRDDNGQVAGCVVNVPINDTTMDYLLRCRVSTPYFSQLTAAELAEYAVPAPARSGSFLRLIAFTDDHDIAARTALMYYLLSLWFREPRSVVTTTFPFYIQLLERIGFVRVPGLIHHEYGPEFPAPTHVLDLRNEHIRTVLEHVIAQAGVADSPLLAGAQLNFTPREHEVAHLVIECLSNAEIAERLGVTEITVKKHLTSIYNKADVRNRLEFLRKMYTAT